MTREPQIPSAVEARIDESPVDAPAAPLNPPPRPSEQELDADALAWNGGEHFPVPAEEEQDPELQETFEEDELDPFAYSDDSEEDFLSDYELGAQPGTDLTKRLNRARNDARNAGSAGGTKASSAGPATVQSGHNRQVGGVLEARERQYEALKKKYGARIKVGDDAWSTTTHSQSVPGTVAAHQRKEDARGYRDRDRSDRATVEGVLDPRTRATLLKIVKSGCVEEINGCISTGKEANVYHATSPTGEHLAVKVYRTSVLSFKDRDRYVTGEHRFRKGYARHNPRKMVRLWAEKEARNLRRMEDGGVKAPKVAAVRGNVVVMEMVGDVEGTPAPRLKDAQLDTSESVRACYFAVLKETWKLYNRCGLVHADLSEYNILYHDHYPVLIDVSQSVSPDHPHALEFLRRDCVQVGRFFTERGAGRVMGARDMFEFVVGGREGVERYVGEVAKETEGGCEETEREVEEGLLDAYLEKFHTSLDLLPLSEYSDHQRQVDEEVFLKSFIPRTLNEVQHVERDVEKVARGEAGELIYSMVAPVVHEVEAKKAPASAVANLDPTPPPSSLPASPNGDVVRDATPVVEKVVDATSSSSDGTSDTSSDAETTTRLKRHEDKDAKRERKQAVKEANREKRKTKVPKAVKKKREKQAVAGKKR